MPTSAASMANKSLTSLIPSTPRISTQPYPSSTPLPLLSTEPAAVAAPDSDDSLSSSDEDNRKLSSFPLTPISSLPTSHAKVPPSTVELYALPSLDSPSLYSHLPSYPLPTSNFPPSTPPPSLTIEALEPEFTPPAVADVGVLPYTTPALNFDTTLSVRAHYSLSVIGNRLKRIRQLQSILYSFLSRWSGYAQFSSLCKHSSFHR